MQGTRDELAELPLLQPIVRGLGRRARLHVIDAADHGFDVRVRSGRTGAEVRAEIARTVAGWMARTTRPPRATATAASSRRR